MTGAEIDDPKIEEAEEQLIKTGTIGSHPFLMAFDRWAAAKRIVEMRVAYKTPENKRGYADAMKEVSDLIQRILRSE